MIEFGPFRYDPESRLLHRGSKEIALSPRVTAVLEALLERAGEVVPKDEVLSSAWEGAFVGEDSLTQAVSQLRQALGDDHQRPTYIQTIPRRGYRFVAEVSDVLRSNRSDPDPVRQPGSDHEPSPETADSYADEEAPLDAGTADVAIGVPAPRTRSKILRWVAATTLVAVGAALIAALGFWAWNGPGEDLRAVSIPVRLPAGFELDRNPLSLAISPSGGRLAYIGRYGGEPRRLFVHEVGELEPRVIPGTEEARFPFFSPDGRSVGFRQTGELKTVSLDGGDPVSLARVSGLKGASWGPDGTVVYVPEYGAGIWRVSADGGEPELVIAPEKANDELDLLWPAFLPDGDHVLYTSTGSDRNRADIAVVSLATGVRETLHSGGFYPRYSPPGYLVFGQRDLLFAAPFDAERRLVTGSAAALSEVVRMAQAEGSADFALAADGSLVYISAGSAPLPDPTMVLVDRQGTIEPLGQVVGNDPRFSPDGMHLVTWWPREQQDVWRYDLVRDARSRVTLDPAWDGYPIWTPDGTGITFSTDRAGGAWRLFQKSVDGSDAAELLLETDHTAYPDSWSKDGRLLAFTRRSPEARTDIWVYSADNPADPEVFVATEFAESDASFSPNGKFIAYHSDETGRSEIYVRPYPERSPRAVVSTGGGAYPKWGPNGKELFYVGPLSTGGDLMVVSLETEPELIVGAPRLLLDAGPDSPQRLSTDRGYDVSPDGQRFVLFVQEQVAPRQLNLVLNWSAGLSERVPRGR